MIFLWHSILLFISLYQFEALFKLLCVVLLLKSCFIIKEMVKWSIMLFSSLSFSDTNLYMALNCLNWDQV